MNAEIVECRPLPEYRLWLRFGDGAEGVADLSHLVGQGVFAAWNDPAVFEQVTIDATAGTVGWPGGLDLDPYVLYSRVTGAPLPGTDASRATSR
jgi:hypothetical protein